MIEVDMNQYNKLLAGYIKFKLIKDVVSKDDCKYGLNTDTEKIIRAIVDEYKKETERETE